MTLTLSIAFNNHDSSVAIGDEHKVLLVLEAERHFREKKKRCSRHEMEELIAVSLQLVGATISDVEHTVLTTLRNEFVPPDLRYTRSASEATIELLGQRRRSLLVNHHVAHAGIVCALPCKPTLITSCDGGGDMGERNEYFMSDGVAIHRIASNNDNAVTAKLYDVVSQYLYGNVRCEGKLMALSAFGKPQNRYLDVLRRGRTLLSTGTYVSCFGYLREHWAELAGLAATHPMDVADCAASTQYFFEEERIYDIRTVLNNHPHPQRLLVVGGAALNIVLNSRIRSAFPHLEVIVPPCCDDTGQALGALLYAHTIRTGNRLGVDIPFLGAGDHRANLGPEVQRKVVDLLIANKVIAFHHGRAEIGPRALGHRSFLANASTLEMRSLLNDIIKQRESYRPLAPMILLESIDRWFVDAHPSPYMLFSFRAKPETHRRMPAAIHRDGTARVQTVSHQDEPIFSLLADFRRRTGLPGLLNTSLNLRGAPLVNTLDDTKAIVQMFPGSVVGVHNGDLLY